MQHRLVIAGDGAAELAVAAHLPGREILFEKGFGGGIVGRGLRGLGAHILPRRLRFQAAAAELEGAQAAAEILLRPLRQRLMRHHFIGRTAAGGDAVPQRQRRARRQGRTGCYRRHGHGGGRHGFFGAAGGQHGGSQPHQGKTVKFGSIHMGISRPSEKRSDGLNKKRITIQKDRAKAARFPAERPSEARLGAF